MGSATLLGRAENNTESALVVVGDGDIVEGESEAESDAM